MTEFASTQASERMFTAETSSIGAARRFVRGAAAAAIERRGPDDHRDLELATSELVTNAVEYGLDEPIAVRVTVTPTAVSVSVRSARSSAAIADPSSWAGPLPAMRTGRGLAIVRAVSDEVAVEADDHTVTVHCTFHTV
jgi:anti-sigma regulatory factor (Ser/Thr protein kinase)